MKKKNHKYIKSLQKQGIPILSCDKLRLLLNPKKYEFNPEKEKYVWKVFYGKVCEMRTDFIIDNTNCKIEYINKIKVR